MNEQPTRMKCPNCGRFIGTVEGTYLEAVPCDCGWQTTMRRSGTAREVRPRPFRGAVEAKAV